jgi:hypothetical protein
MTDDPLAPMRRFARPSADAKRAADPLLCRHLRPRTWLAPDTFGSRDPRQSPATAPYLCLRTMRPSGPDGDPAAPEPCTDERICFEAAVGPGGDS